MLFICQCCLCLIAAAGLLHLCTALTEAAKYLEEPRLSNSAAHVDLCQQYSVLEEKEKDEVNTSMLKPAL